MHTRKIPTSEAVPGMIVSEDIYGLQDYLIIPAQSELTNHSITRLKFYAIHEISIIVDEQGEPEHSNLGEFLTDSYSEYIKKTAEFKKFSASFADVTDDLKSKIATLNNKLKAPIATDELLQDMQNILSETRNGTHVVHMLHCMRDNDDETFAHAVSVALLCNVFGHWLRYSEEDIKVLTLCGLLHDVGKMLIPSAIISKPARLSNMEFDIVKSHTVAGYNLLADQNLDERVKNTVLMHHERRDGSGYPNGLKEAEIEDFAQIVAIVDVYEAMTSPRAYRRANCPFDAMSIFEQEGFEKFNPVFLLAFLEGMANTYINCTVRLNDDRLGEIIMIDAQHITRPVVKVDNIFIDLNKNKQLSILEIV